MEYEELKHFIELKKAGIEGNALKDKIDTHIINKWLNPKKFNGKGFVQAFTGFGKTYLAGIIFKRYRVKFTDAIVVIVPNNNLLNEFKKLGRELGIDNYYVYVINTYVMSEDESIVRDCGLCFMDELHRMCSEMSDHFQKAIPITNSKLFLGVSATLEKKHIDFLETFTIREVFTITVPEGMKLDIIPDYEIYNVGVDLTPREKASFYKNDKIFKSSFELFNIGDGWNTFDLMMGCARASGFKCKVERRFGETTSIEEANSDYWCTIVANEREELQELGTKQAINKIRSKAFIARTAMMDRDDIINNSEGKIQAVIDILKTIEDNNANKEQKDYTITFMDSVKRINQVEQLCNNRAFAYHSKLGVRAKRDRLSMYKQGVFNHLLTVKSLDEGFDEKKASIGILEAYSSKVRQSTQRLGRFIRLDEKNPNKRPIAIFLYSKPFEFEEEEVQTNDFKKLNTIQKDLLNINYIDLDRCLEILKRR